MQQNRKIFSWRKMVIFNFQQIDSTLISTPYLLHFLQNYFIFFPKVMFLKNNTNTYTFNMFNTNKMLFNRFVSYALLHRHSNCVVIACLFYLVTMSFYMPQVIEDVFSSFVFFFSSLGIFEILGGNSATTQDNIVS